MNGGVEIVNQNPIDPNPVPKVELPSYIKRGLEITGSLVVGGSIGHGHSFPRQLSISDSPARKARALPNCPAISGVRRTPRSW